MSAILKQKQNSTGLYIHIYTYSLRKNSRFPHYFDVFSKMVLFSVTAFYTVPFYCTSVFKKPKLEYWKVPKEGCN